MAQKSSLAEALFVTNLSDSDLTHISPNDLENAVIAAMASGFGDRFAVNIDMEPEETNIAMSSGSVLPPYKFEDPSEDEIAEMKRRLNV